MSKMVCFFDYRPYPKMLMFSTAANSSPATRLSMLTYLTPTAIPCTSLFSAFSKPSCHMRYTLLNKRRCKYKCKTHMLFNQPIPFFLQFQVNLCYSLGYRHLRIVFCFSFSNRPWGDSN